MTPLVGRNKTRQWRAGGPEVLLDAIGVETSHQQFDGDGVRRGDQSDADHQKTGYHLGTPNYRSELRPLDYRCW